MSTKLALSATCFAMALCASPTTAEDPAKSPPQTKPTEQPKADLHRLGPKWLLMANDTIEQADVTKDAAGFILRYENGIKARRPETGILFMADAPTEIYKFKSDQIPTNDYSERQKLAVWCFRFRMFGEAAGELKAILAQKPDNRNAAALLKMIEKPNAGDSSRGELDESRVTADAGAGDAKGGYGAELVTQYNNTVQLILFNKCGGCHANTRYQGEFKLIRQRGKPLTATMTNRNFRAVEAMIDLRAPAKSRLLEMAITPHGGKSSIAVFGGPHDTRFRELRDWVYAMSRNWNESMQEPGGAAVADNGASTVPSHRPGVEPPAKSLSASGKNLQSTRPGGKMKPPSGDRPGFTNAADDAPPTPPRTMPKPAKKPESAPVHDPFDPAQFNAGGAAEAAGAGSKPKKAEPVENHGANPDPKTP